MVATCPHTVLAVCSSFVFPKFCGVNGTRGLYFLFFITSLAHKWPKLLYNTNLSQSSHFAYQARSVIVEDKRVTVTEGKGVL
jgi:hypothetical protein